MKRAERHHLKENEIQLLTRQAREAVAARKRETTAAVVAVVVIGAIALGYFGWRERVQSRAHAMLADAMVVHDARVAPVAAELAPGSKPAPTTGTFPTEQARAEAALVKLKATADKYPSSDAGIYARYQQAATLMSLGRFTEAASCYEQVVSRAGDGIYGQMGRLGFAEANARAGQFDRAINSFKELAQRKDGPLPVDGVLMQLGRTYLDAGKRAEAQQTFNRLVEEYPESQYSGEARRELDNLKKS